ncbi:MULTISPECIES: hypothetical protein [Streptomyces]|uniref:NTP pyrophosphohydrolase MazG putative catalytic core domain-containing protein n=2 Tax=Streptomyces TaxID=1883 RepID=A0ABV9JCC0_9ACTN
MATRPAAPSADLWPTLRSFVEWLDRHNGRDWHETAMRLLKVAEEAGEAAQAYITSRGRNPRKAPTSGVHQVTDELVDVAVTALVALHSFVANPEEHFNAKLQEISDRVARVEAAPESMRP